MRTWTMSGMVSMAVVVLGSLAGSADATVVSLNFQGSNTVALGPADSTGAPPNAAANWNNVTGASGGPVVLNDSTGGLSAVTLTSYSAGPFGAEGGNTANSTPQQILFGGALNVNFGSASFVISGLSAYSSYDLVVYYSAGTSFPNDRHAQITASGSPDTYYVAGNNSVYTSFIQSNSTSAGTYSSGNYVVFSGLTSPTETVTMGNENNSLGLVGFQVIGTPVPEPTALGFLSLGSLGLLVRKRRIG